MKKLLTLIALAVLAAGCSTTDNANTANGNKAVVVNNNANNANTTGGAANANNANAHSNANH
jgi:hypothetical protein